MDRPDTDTHAVLEFPRNIQLETTARCNLRCKMCAAKGGLSGAARPAGPRPDMPEELYRKIVRDLGAHAGHIAQLSLFMDGEPLLDRLLPRRIRAAKEAGLKTVSIATNAMLLRGDTAEALLASGLDHLIVSIDGVTPETYEAIRIGARLETVERNVLDFLRLRDAAGRTLPQVEARMIVMPENAHERDAFRERWQNTADEVTFSAVHNWGNCLAEGEGPGAVPVCNWPHRYMVIYSDGRAGFCCLDYEGMFDLGSFQTATLEEIWRGEAYARVRRALEDRDPHVMAKCAGCTHATRAPFAPGGWKKLLLRNPGQAPVRVSLAFSVDGGERKGAPRTLAPGAVFAWGIPYEGQAGVDVLWGEDPPLRTHVALSPAQRYYEAAPPPRV